MESRIDTYPDEMDDVQRRIYDLANFVADLESRMDGPEREAPHVTLLNEVNELRSKVKDVTIAVEDMLGEIEQMKKMVENCEEKFGQLKTQTELHLAAMEEQLTRANNKHYGAF